MILFLDFDGTITPIVSSPELAVLSAETRAVLKELNEAPNTRVAVVSGRSIGDLKQRVALPLIYAGNHGLEIEGPGMQFRHELAEQLAPRLLDVLEPVRRVLAHVPDILFEQKGLTASVHYRQVPSGLWPFVIETVQEIVSNSAPGFLTRNGKRVVEIRPAIDWNKGRAALWILDQLGVREETILCMGDDETDEDLFRLLPEAETYHVGQPGESAARYTVPSPEEAVRVLQNLLPIAAR